MKNGMKQTEIGEIPMEWEVAKLGSITNINQASLPGGTDEDYSFWYIDLSTVKQGEITFPKEKIRFGDSSPRARRKIKEGDVLVATVRPNLLGYAIAKFDTTDTICSTGFAVISPKKQIIGEFIYQWLYTDTLQSQINKLTVGSNYPAINSSDVAGFLIPLPPLPEQRKIAEILSTLDEKMAVIDEQLAQTQKLKKGLMQRLLTKGIGHTQFKDSPLGEIPAGWEATQLQDVLSAMQSGLSRRLVPQDIGLPVLRSNNIRDGKVLFDDLKYWFVDDPQGAKTKDYHLKTDDILVNFINSPSQIGKCAMYKDTAGRNVIYTTNILRLTTNEKCLPIFVYYSLNTEAYKMFLSFITKPAVNQASFTTKDFKKYNFGLPPLPEQRQIAEILTTVDEKIGVLQDKKVQVHTLKKGLMQQLLTGQRRVRVSTPEVAELV